jgi:hypothetical protein
VERGSSKHGAREDDELKRETESIVRSARESRAEEWREAEPSGEDEPAVSPDPEGSLAGGAPPGMTPDDVRRRSELAGYLESAPFPAVREQLIETAIDRHAPDAIVDQVRRLPSGRTFDNVGEVWAALGGGSEAHRF